MLRICNNVVICIEIQCVTSRNESVVVIKGKSASILLFFSENHFVKMFKEVFYSLWIEPFRA